jgi:polar amino acid transport system substrate-binding protein
MTITLNPTVVAELAPNGVLRAGINLSNFLLVTGRAANGDPQGIAPDMAGEIASRLKVPLQLIAYESPGKLAACRAEAMPLSTEPARAAQIAFSAAYLEIEATYLVLADSKIRSVEEIDRKGVRIAVAARSAYDLYLSRSIKNAELMRATGLDASYELFVREPTRSPVCVRVCESASRTCPACVCWKDASPLQQAVARPRRVSQARPFSPPSSKRRRLRDSSRG